MAENSSLGYAHGINSAILRYEGAPAEEPCEQEAKSINPLREYNLHSLEDPAAVCIIYHDTFASKPDLFDDIARGTLRRRCGLRSESRAGLRTSHLLRCVRSCQLTLLQNNASKTPFNINGVPFQSPSVPVLLQILSGAKKAQDLLPAGSVYGLPRNSSIELSIQPLSIGGPHPFHLHGVRSRSLCSHIMRGANAPARHVLARILCRQKRWSGSAKLCQPNQARCREHRVPGRQCHDPLQGEWLCLSLFTGRPHRSTLQTDNPGPWLLHCHIDWHLSGGLAIVFAEDVGDTSFVDPAPSEYLFSCVGGPMSGRALNWLVFAEEWYDLCPEYEASIANDPTHTQPNP